MDFRPMDKLGMTPSLLGFGCMRFPQTANNKIDEKKAMELIDAAYAGGVNYFDTAYVYHDMKSESFTGRALKKYRRDSYYLATKLPVWIVKKKDDVLRIFNEQLMRLDTDYVDFYLLHALGKDSWKKMLDLDAVKTCEKLQREGKIKAFGFSFHDSYEAFEEILLARAWDFCQIQLNYMDTEEQAGIKGYELAAKNKVPIIVMEPVKGGSLAALPDDIAKKLLAQDPKSSLASWAMRFVASLPHVNVILSGMSTLEQVCDNVATTSRLRPLNNDEQVVIKDVADQLRRRVKNGCTACDYCMPCPFGVNIPYNFKIWNEQAMYLNDGDTKWQWLHAIQDDAKAKNCTQCGQCEDACPQKIMIRRDLSLLQDELDAIGKNA